MKFCKFFENLRKSLTIFCCDFRFRAVQKCDNLVDLGKCCKMSIYLQNFMPIQPRTSLLKIGHLAAKSGKSTVLYLSIKALPAAGWRTPRGAKVYQSCRSRKMLQNAYLLAKFYADTAQNEPSKVWSFGCKIWERYGTVSFN